MVPELSLLKRLNIVWMHCSTAQDLRVVLTMHNVVGSTKSVRNERERTPEEEVGVTGGSENRTFTQETGVHVMFDSFAT